jgi:hypothetical protein
VRVTVCRDCCCGSVRKHPEVDHGAQVARLRAIGEKVGATVRLAECLDTCETSNVVVVQAPGAKPVWLGWVLSEAVLDDIEAWLTSGGPGVAPLSDVLELHRITAPGQRGAQ